MTTHTMKKMLAGLLTSAMLFGGVTVASAESPDGDQAAQVERMERMERKLDRKVAKLTRKLNLTDAQASKLRQIIETRRTEVMDARQRLKGDKEAKRAEMKRIRAASKAEIDAVLDANQRAQMDAIRAKHADRKAKKGKRGMKKGKKGARLAKMLDLSDAQKAQFKAIHKEAKQEREAILAAVDGDRSAAKPELKALRQDTQAKVDAILDDSQRAKLAELRAERKARKGDRKAR